MAKIVVEMEKIRDAVKIVEPKLQKEPIGHSKLRIEDSKAAKDVQNDRVSVRIQTPVTACAEVNTMADLHAEAIEINSADEVRQAIKATLAKKPMMANQNVYSEKTELVPVLPKEAPVPREVPHTREVSHTKEFPVHEIEEYKPESGDQVHVPQKSRKRQGKSTKAGPSKRPRTKIIDDFYIGKLSNLVPFTKKFSSAHSEKRKPRPYNGLIW